MKIIDKDATHRFDAVYGDLLRPFQQGQQDGDWQALQDQANDQRHLRALRARAALRSSPKKAGEACGAAFTELENLEIQKRQQIAGEYEGALEEEDEQQTQANHVKYLAIFMQGDDNMVKSRPVAGAGFSQEGMRQIALDQKGVEGSMLSLESKYTEVSEWLAREYEKFDKKLNNKTLKALYLSLSLQALQRKRKKTDSLNQERVVDQLRKELESDSLVPEGVLSILTNDLKDRKDGQTQHNSETGEKAPHMTRMSKIQLSLIRQEFEEVPGF